MPISDLQKTHRNRIDLKAQTHIAEVPFPISKLRDTVPFGYSRKNGLNIAFDSLLNHLSGKNLQCKLWYS